MSNRYKMLTVHKVTDDLHDLPPFGKDLVLITSDGRLTAGRLDYLNASGLHFRCDGGLINGVTEWADGTELMPKPEGDGIPVPPQIKTKAIQFSDPELVNATGLPAIPQDNLNPVALEAK